MNTLTAKTLFIVPSFHYDVAYLKTYRDYLPLCFRILDEALRLLDQHPEYRFMVEQVILLEAYWTERPERREDLVRFAREGRLAVAPGFYVMPDMNHCDGESLYQQARLGRDWLERHLGLAPDVCWIADCWGHHAQLPQILAQCGYRYYAFWRCMRRDVLRTRFHWEGLNGTRLRTHWLAKGYGNIRFPSDEEIQNAPDLDLAGSGRAQIESVCAELLRFEPLPSLMLCNGGDFMVPQASAPATVRRLNASGELPPIRFGTPKDFLDSLAWDTAPVVTGEFNSSLQGTFTSHIRIKQRNREGVRRLLALETLSVIQGARPHDFTPLWKPLLKQQFHDIICGTITDAAVLDSHAEFDDAEKAMTAFLAAASPAHGVPAVFNPLGFARRETLDHDGGRIAISLPPLGFAALAEAPPLPQPAAVALPLVFENAFYRAVISRDGYLTGLVETQSGQELIQTGPAPFGSLGLQLDYGDLWLNFESPLSGGSLESSLTQNNPDPYDRSTPGELANRSTFKAMIESTRAEQAGDEELTIEQTGLMNFWRLNIRFVTRLRLSKKSARIEYETRLKPEGKHYRLRAAFPTSLAGGEILHEVPFGIQSRGEHEHVAQHWTACAGNQAGLAVLNAGTPGNTVDSGILMLTLFRAAAMEYKSASELGFQEGVPHLFRYAVMPFATGNETEVVRQGHAFNQPPLLVHATPDQCRKSAWQLEGDPNVQISALRWSESDVFLRVYECAGKEGHATLRIPGRFSTWAPADGLQRPQGAFTPCPPRLPLSLKKFEIQGFLLRAP